MTLSGPLAVKILISSGVAALRLLPASNGELMIDPGQTESVAFQLPVFQGSVHAKSIFEDELRIQNITLQQHDTGLMRTESMGIIGTIESASIYSLLQTQNLYSINQYAEVTRNRLHTLRH